MRRQDREHHGDKPHTGDKAHAGDPRQPGQEPVKGSAPTGQAQTHQPAPHPHGKLPLPD